MGAWRIILASVGILTVLYGIGRLFAEVPMGSLMGLGIWLIAALIIHDGILSPVILGVGWLLNRLLPARARTFVQAGLIMAFPAVVIAIPMIIKQGTFPPVKELLTQNYGRNLGILLGLVAALTLIAYAIRVAHDHRTPTETEPRRQAQDGA